MGVREQIPPRSEEPAAPSLAAASLKAPIAGVACAAFLLLLSLALPWAGWQGLRTIGPTVALAGAALFVLTIAGWCRHGAPLALLAGAAAAALIGWRLSAPTASQSTGALLLGLGGTAVLMLAAAAWVARRPVAVRPCTTTLDLEQRAAVTSAWSALWRSRLLVWTAGTLGVLKLGLEPSVHPPPLSRPFGALGNLLASPASAWDAGNYVAIAHNGYAPGLYWRAFFPFYPTLVRAGGWSPRAALIMAIALAVGAFLVALYLLHRLVSLECGSRVAELAVAAMAFSPMALFFSAAYSESIFLALSVGAFYAARRGWWAPAGVAGAFAAATRTTGVVLLLPLLILYLYGPRLDRPRSLASGSRWRPRYPLAPDAGFLLLVPLGALAYFAYMAAHGDAAAPLHAQRVFWYRHFVPGFGAIKGLIATVQSLRQIAGGPISHILSTPSFQAAGQLSDPLKLAAANVTDFAFFVFACSACVGALRRLPAAYGLYALATVALTVSTYGGAEPLFSFPRFLVVVFPCQMWLALWAARGSRWRPTLLISAGLLAFFATQFATWRWVA